MALLLPVRTDNALQRKPVEYLSTNRPWLSLYGTRVRPISGFGSLCNSDQSLIHRILPDELLFEVFSRMTPNTLGRAACVCRKWRYAIRNPSLWRSACINAWQICGIEENFKILQVGYGGSWYRMWRHRPRLRFDGIYVSRNTYIRTGIAEWITTNPVHLVCYYRYIRFFPSGRCLYKNSSQKIKDVAKSMQAQPSKNDAVFPGRYTITTDKVEATFLYPGLRPTILKISLRLRGTIVGANNRLDIVSIVTGRVNENDVEGNAVDTEGLLLDENNNLDIPAVSHRRGLAPLVFVPFEEVDTSDLNLSVDKMDYYVPG